MSRTMTDVAIIGAGPYGLSIASHLQSLGIAFRIFGVPIAQLALSDAGRHVSEI